MDLTPEETLMMNMIGAAPEREDDIRALWDKYHPRVDIVDTEKLRLDATGDCITIDVKVPDVFWLIGFAGWRAIETYIPAVMCAAQTRQPVAEVLQGDDELPEVERDYKERIAAAQKFLAAGNSSTAPWPDDIPRPSSDRNALADNQYIAAFDLTTSAVAFTIFHEFYHVILDQEGMRPAELPEEELACDVWARDFVTSNLHVYAKSHNLNFDQVLSRRAMALALAALIINEITPEWERGGNCSYFSVSARMEAIIENTPLPHDSNFWNFAAALMVGICRQRHIRIDAPGMSARELASHLLSLL